jgi:hypothetical protein
MGVFLYRQASAAVLITQVAQRIEGDASLAPNLHRRVREATAAEHGISLTHHCQQRAKRHFRPKRDCTGIAVLTWRGANNAAESRVSEANKCVQAWSTFAGLSLCLPLSQIHANAHNVQLEKIGKSR